MVYSEDVQALGQDLSDIETQLTRIGDRLEAQIATLALLGLAVIGPDQSIMDKDKMSELFVRLHEMYFDDQK